MKKTDLHSVYKFILAIIIIVNIELQASEPNENILTSSNNAIHLDFWQIVKDKEPTKPLPLFPDSLWQSFDSYINDDLFSKGNWVLKTTINIADSLDGNTVVVCSH